MSSVENRVGKNAPRAEVMAQYLKQLNDIATQLQKFGLILSSDARRSMTRARRGAEVMMVRVSEMAQKYGVSVPGVSLDEMGQDIALMKAMRPLTDLLSTLQRLTTDTGAQAESEAWQAFLAYYAVLSSAAPRNPALADELAPVKEFMSNKKKAK